MIPKVIHYCWFGRNPLPESAIKCINSWRKYFPDYEIKEWNEDNFDVNIIPYTSEAYEAKKYAFVSDYARFWILYNYGGLYFDTDVEIIKQMDDIVDQGPFLGIEINSAQGKHPLVNPGLGIGAFKNMVLYKVILDHYSSLHYLLENGSQNQVTVVKYTTNILIEFGLKPCDDLQLVDEIWIYPSDYFNPFDDNTGRLHITENTRSIHWYSKTWLKKRNQVTTWLIRLFHRCFGNNSLSWIRRLF